MVPPMVRPSVLSSISHRFGYTVFQAIVDLALQVETRVLPWQGAITSSFSTMMI